MVKGISRQVIVVRSPDPKLFEQAIFNSAGGCIGEGRHVRPAILRQAQQAAGSYVPAGKRRALPLGKALWAAGGALVTGLAWLLTVIL